MGMEAAKMLIVIAIIGVIIFYIIDIFIYPSSDIVTSTGLLLAITALILSMLRLLRLKNDYIGID